MRLINVVLSFAANLVSIVIFSRGNCGLSKCITRYLVGMAVGDLMVMIFEVILYEIKEGYFPYSFLNYTPICSLNVTLFFVSIDWSVWLTVAFTFDRFVAICHQTVRTKYCTEKTATVVISVVCVLSVLENVPYYFTWEPGELIDNVPWFCRVKEACFTLPIWAAFLWLETILTPFAPFALILLFNSLTVRHILLANRVRVGLRGNKNVDSQADPEMENRRKSIILLLAISANFLLLWALILIFYIFVQLTDAHFLATTYNKPITIMELSAYMLRCLSSCTNTFIYAVSQKKFRAELKNMVVRPMNCIRNAVKC